MSERRSIALDCVLLFVLTSALIWPLYTIVYLDNWMSIEGAFIGDVRYISEHWRHPRWHSLWYCGNRFDYIYPPLTRYGAAAIARVAGVEPAHGYHIYTAFMYCLGVSGVYFLARVGMRSRRAAWVAAAAHALISPSFLFLPEVRADSLHLMPERLNVLIKWGEGPHVSALALVPWAIAFAWSNGRISLAASALAAALAVSNNFYGGVTLAVMMAVAVIARVSWQRALAIAVLAYGLCAWWLTPSYITLTARNLKLVALPGHAWSQWTAAAVLIAFAIAARRKQYATFVTGIALVFAMVVLGHAWFDFRVTGDPKRFYPEFDLAITLAAVEALRRFRRVSIVAAVVAFASAAWYLASPWSVFTEDRAPRERIEYKLSEWMRVNMPGARAYATGSVRLWYGTWYDLEQVGGGSDQGLDNLTLSLAQWQINVDNDARRDVDWLVALGADAVISHDPESQEIYKSIQHPRKFTGLLPVLYDAGGDIIYKVPRHNWSRAHPVDEARMRALAPLPWVHENGPALRAYVEAISASESKVAYEWQGVNGMRLRGTTRPGESILVQETWDEGWRATESGRPLTIVNDSIGFFRVLVEPGDHDIRLDYELPLESRIGRWVTIASLLALLVVGARRAGTPTNRHRL